ncbi:hypothetical protein FHX42_001245 [Saccharopolyspora lacisalsi]|uniref:Uncharacterized protein n=1 Tax=Halosaccharopolyspora lacisalsi TaxID=1000566 RepID=A0A839DUH3_9PSEU|nr:hypothetical protein [Halosaccharopolyspora lacisalsi]MBA8823916.1 hypothetical protein [Halosaccharopolyspora lacisalsi]
MVAGGVVLMLAGAVVLTSSALALSRANPTAVLPRWSNPPRQPVRARLLRGAGAGLAVYGSILLSSLFGYWSVGLIAVAFAGVLGVHGQHNRQVRTACRTE